MLSSNVQALISRLLIASMYLLVLKTTKYILPIFLKRDIKSLMYNIIVATVLAHCC